MATAKLYFFVVCAVLFLNIHEPASKVAIVPLSDIPPVPPLLDGTLQITMLTDEMSRPFILDSLPERAKKQLGAQYVVEQHDELPPAGYTLFNHRRQLLLYSVDNRGNIVMAAHRDHAFAAPTSGPHQTHYAFIHPRPFNATHLVTACKDDYSVQLFFCEFHKNDWTAKSTELEGISSHDIRYSPQANAVVRLKGPPEAKNEDYLVEEALDGTVLWSFSFDKFIKPLRTAQAVQSGLIPRTCQEGSKEWSCGDWMHANTCYWDYESQIVYMMARKLHTFFAIKVGGSILWSCGLLGTLRQEGVANVGKGEGENLLFYGAHEITPLNGTDFLLFDNQQAEPVKPTHRSARVSHLRVNLKENTCKLVKSYSVNTGSSRHMGSSEKIPWGHYTANYAQKRKTVEFNENGKLVWSLHRQPAAGVRSQQADLVSQSYRAQRYYEKPVLGTCWLSNGLWCSVWNQFQLGYTTKGHWELYRTYWPSPSISYKFEKVDVSDTVRILQPVIATHNVTLVSRGHIEFLPHWQENHIRISLTTPPDTEYLHVVRVCNTWERCILFQVAIGRSVRVVSEKEHLKYTDDEVQERQDRNAHIVSAVYSAHNSRT